MNLSAVSNPSKSMSGFSLLELLLSMFVLSLGVIGTLKTQLTSIQATEHAYFYSSAMTLASEMAEKIYAQQEQLNVEHEHPFLAVDFDSARDSLTSAEMCYEVSCSPVQFAKAELAEWLHHVYTVLPRVRAVICRDKSPWSNDTGTLKWNCSSTDASDSIIIKLGWTERHDVDDLTPPRFAISVTP